MSENLETIVADLHTHFTSDPNSRLHAGISENLGCLPDPSLADSARTRDAAQALLTRLEAVDSTGLEFDSGLDLELAKLIVGYDVHDHSYQFNGKSKRQQMPKAGDEIGDGVFLLFINDPRDATARLDDIVGRLEAAPDFTEKMLARLDTPVARWVKMDLQTVEGLPTLFATVENWAAETGYADLERLQSARKGAEAALASYAEKLGAMPTTEQMHVGPEVARRIVSLRGIDKSFDELHTIARDFLGETRETIETLRKKLASKYELDAGISTEDLQLYLAEKYRVDLPTGNVDDILAHYEDSRKEILAFIKERDLFPILENQNMKIIRTPSFMAPSIPAGAMMPPPAFRDGVRTSMVYLTLSEELVDEHTALGIPSMMVHEGIPGHHLQLATASTHKSIVRRHVSANEHAEGWTTMLEDYMLDTGFKADLADEVRFIGKRDLSRIGARVAIDLFFMTGEKKYLDVGVDCDTSSADPFEAAGSLLQAVTGFVPGRVQAELNWYSQERGYPLSYLTGNKLVWELKEDLAQAQNGKLEGLELDRRFHNIYLHSGNMPLTFLRRVFEHEGLLA
ncbi:MAG: DUF885 domain-containing protein [Myxococcales bacterium]|nr:DUF885 domain-containing protein [Myxococcales bacterium]